MVQEDMDEKTPFKSKDITALIDQVWVKHQPHIKLGPAEQINQAIERTGSKSIRPERTGSLITCFPGRFGRERNGKQV